jgi:ribose-phosphate pyrophosphokinase
MPRDPLSTRYVACVIEAVGADHVITLDVHNVAAYENAFRISADHLVAKKLFAEHFMPLLGMAPAAVVSPDIGGMKRADAFCASLERRLGRPVDRAYLEKRRSDGLVSGEMMLAGDVSGRQAIIIDDLVSTGATLGRAVSACKAHGASRVYAAASHALFTAQAGELLANPALDSIAVTDTVPPFQIDAATMANKLRVVSCAPLFAEAIRRMHTGGSVAELLQD